MYENHRLTRSGLVGRPLAAAPLLAVLAAPVLLAWPARAETIRESSHSFTVADKRIAMEGFAPAGERPHPTVLLLHGSQGMNDAFIYRCIARQLAEQGYFTLIIHYFERTGTKQIKPSDITEALFGAWLDTVRQAVVEAARLPEVNNRRIGLLGFSLGAYLSLAAATQTDLAIAAVADFFGGLPEKFRDRADRLPPTLIIHGDQDKTVPLREARTLEKLLREHKRTYEVRIYRGQQHVFRNASPFNPDVADARQRTLDFFDKHLKPPSIVHRP